MKVRRRKAIMKRAMKVLLVLQFVFIYILGGLPLPKASAGSQFLMWTEDGRTFASFGPNQEIRIHTGAIEFTKGCSKDGVDDFDVPFADIYVVQSGQGNPGEKLQDVSGAPNTVQGAHGGLFISELIGATAPGGSIGPGTYTVVYDECQDGTVSPEDKVFPGAFEVVFPTDMPDIMADPAIAKLKQAAGESQEEWESIHTSYEMLFTMQSNLGTVGKVWQCSGLKEMALSVSTSFSLTLVCPKVGGGPLPGPNPWDIKHSGIIDGFFTGLTKGVEIMTGVNPKQMALKHILSTASHYKGIHADPPNPDFQKLTPLETRDLIETDSNDPETIAFVGLGNELSNEAPLLKSFLTSIERYQGSALEKNGEWSLIHARAVQDYSAQLKQQVARTNTAIDIAKQVLEADPRPFDEIATELQAFRDEVAVQGLPIEQVRELKNLGFTDIQINDMKTQLLSKNLSFNKTDVISQLDELKSTNEVLVSSFTELEKNMKEHWIEYIKVLPSVDDLAPIVNAGGPYTGQEGSVINFSGSLSTSPTDIVSYEWDLDGDGEFDDATGVSPTYKYMINVNKLLGLKVTNKDGWSNIGYATVFIENSNKGPSITAMVPDRASTEIVVGESKEFSIEAADQENDQVNVEWYIDRIRVKEGNGFTFTPTEDQVGKHIIEAIVSDDSTHSGYETVSWPVSVLMADNDEDGWNSNVDCDDSDSNVFPGATEKPGNGKDDDCDRETTDISLKPIALFYPGGFGKNVALFESGATVEAFSSQYDSSHSPQQMIDANINSNPWATRSKDNQWVKISLAEGKTYLIDRIELMPRPGFPGQRVKDFEVAVSTDGEEFTTVLEATAENNGNLQEFKLSKPVLAKYVMYRPLNAQDGGSVISTQQFKVKTSLISSPTVTFNNLSTDPENDIISWEWNFGDDKPVSTEKSPTHVYDEPGTYTVTLKATDAAGNIDTYSLEQTVEAADFAFLPKVPKEGEYVTFYNTSVGVEEGDIVSSTWNFGDKTPAVTTSAKSYTHIFRDNETYTVTLETLNKKGQTQKITKKITPVNVNPTVEIGMDITVRSGKKVDFTASIYDPGTDNRTCHWDFGDDTTSDTCSTSHTYPLLEKDAPDKSYTATLTVTDDDGGVSSDSKVVTVRAERDPKLVALYTFDNDYKDYSGNNNNGTPVGTMSFADGIKGKAAKFDGKSGITVQDSDSLDLSTAFSFSMWLYKEDAGAGGWAPILTKGDKAEYGPYALLHSSNGVSPGVRLTGGATTSPSHLLTSVNTNFKEWYLFTTTWDGSTIKYYVNDILVDSQPWNDVFKNDSSQLLIGYDPPGVTEYFRGLMDDFRVYSYSLSPDEIKDLYNQTPAKDEVAPVTVAEVTPTEPNGEGGWYTGAVGMTLTATDDDSGVDKTEYRINNGDWNVYMGAIPFYKNGSYTIEYRSTDKAGNIEVTKSTSIKLDKTSPVTVAKTVPAEPDGDNGWYVSKTEITLSATDDDSGVEKLEYRINEKEWKVYEQAIKLETEGIQKLEYRSTDKAGNTEIVKSVEVKLDKTDPETTANVFPVEPSGKNGWYTKDVTIGLTPNDDLSGIEKTEYRVDSGVWVAYESPIMLTQDSNHLVEYRSFDKAGNSEEIQSITVKLDKTTPSTTINTTPSDESGKGGWYTSDVTLELVAKDQHSGVEKIEYKLNDGEWATYKDPILLTNQGMYRIEYRSLDYAGNTEDIKVAEMKLDKTSPTTTINVTPGEPTGENGWYTTDVTMELLPDDQHSGVEKTEYRINGNEWVVYQSPINLTTDGLHLVEYRSIDFAGNIEEIKGMEVKIDKTLPELSIKLNKNTIWPPNHKMVTIKATPEVSDLSDLQSVILTSITSSDPEDGVGDGSTELDIQNASFGTADFVFDLRAERSGTSNYRVYTITYTVTDQAGNERSVISTVTVVHDQSGEDVVVF